MKARATFVLTTLAILAIISAGFTTVYVLQAQPSEEEARAAFDQLGCVSCHNGTVAADWDQIVSLLSEVPDKYGGDIDAFARDIVYFGQKGAFQTWDELMAQMAVNVGVSTDDPNFVLVNQFFLSVAGVEGAPADQVETTPAETQPQETEEPVETQPEEPEEAKGVPFGLAAVIALVIVILIAAAAYMYAKK
ncbi:MAG: hypothetical protein F7B20_04135 [Aeropyrum sp.]|nr:hypothetical protein [Aeropyrum sp.]MCE4615556.1 hypothetical protein [Aeropyrum sp.]